MYVQVYNTLHIYVYTSLNFQEPWNKASTASASADHQVSDRFLDTFIPFGRVLSRMFQVDVDAERKM